MKPWHSCCNSMCQLPKALKFSRDQRSHILSCNSLSDIVHLEWNIYDHLSDLDYRKRNISVLGRSSWSKRYNGQTIQKKQPNETWGHWDSFENNFKLLIKHMGNWDDIHLLPVNLKCTLIKNSEKKKGKPAWYMSGEEKGNHLASETRNKAKTNKHPVIPESKAKPALISCFLHQV